MSDSSLTSAVVAATQAVQDLTRQERPAAAITLTRTATQSITGASVSIVWQSQKRGQGISWSGATITIPTAGYYTLECSLAFAASVSGNLGITVNGTQLGHVVLYAASTRWVVSYTRYFATGDTFTLDIAASANTTLNLNAEGTLLESPILHVVQLTSVVT